jgi:hypothetical protein
MHLECYLVEVNWFFLDCITAINIYTSVTLIVNLWDFNIFGLYFDFTCYIYDGPSIEIIYICIWIISECICHGSCMLIVFINIWIIYSWIV